MATAKIRAGMADCIIAGGTESMTMVPQAGWKTVPAYSIASKKNRIIISIWDSQPKLSPKSSTSATVKTRTNSPTTRIKRPSKPSRRVILHPSPASSPLNVEEVYVDEKGRRQKGACYRGHGRRSPRGYVDGRPRQIKTRFCRRLHQRG